MNPSHPAQGESGPAMRFGIADASGRIVDTVATESLVDAVQLFENLASQGFRCSAGRRHAGVELLRVFQPTHAAAAGATGHHE